MSDYLFTFTTVRDDSAEQAIQIGGRYFNLFSQAKDMHDVRLGNGDRVFWTGDLSYVADGSAEPLGKHARCEHQTLLRFFEERLRDPWFVKDNLEGVYIIIAYNREEGSVTVFGDFLNRLNLFYVRQGEELFASMRLNRSIRDLAGPELNPCALGNILSQNYCLDAETIYENIKRLGFDQALSLTQSGSKLQERAVFQHVLPYAEDQLEEYGSILTNAVASRMAPVNIVSCSGGWDSTMLVDLLCDQGGPASVRPVLLDLAFADGRLYNVYEVEKVKEICAHYHLEPFRHVVDPASATFRDTYLDYLEDIRQNHLFVLSHHYYDLVSSAKSQFGGDAAVYNGEGCDSLHNFGFSQYISMNYSHSGFAQYADKMKSFLFGPTFLEKIENGTYADDLIYRLFRWHHGLPGRNGASSDPVERYSRYLYDFVFSSERLPLAVNGCPKIFNEEAFKKEYLGTIQTQMKHEIDNMDPERLYSLLTRLYCRYWLKGSNIMRVFYSVGDQGLRPALPYMDVKLIKFLERMPESWGRGLDMNPTKYPLKRFVETRPRFPRDIVARVPHSYLSESDPDIHPLYYDYLCKSTLTDYFKDVLTDRSNLAFLEHPMFNLPHLSTVVDAFLSNRLAWKDHSLLHNIAVVASVLND